MKINKISILLGVVALMLGTTQNVNSQNVELIKPTRTEVVTPLRKASFNNNGECKERSQGGNPREVAGLAFDGLMDGNASRSSDCCRRWLCIAWF
ncbi:hypothetical protein [Flavicella sp.]|uniref:hypothetical protein n=1 Tax=Flavicella sp. TaxID=2957742 RepID=UPI003015C5B5